MVGVEGKCKVVQKRSSQLLHDQVFHQIKSELMIQVAKVTVKVDRCVICLISKTEYLYSQKLKKLCRMKTMISK